MRYKANIISFTGFALSITTFIIGIVLLFFGLWHYLLIDTILFVLGAGIFIRDVWMTLGEVKKSLYRSVYMHRWGN